MSLPAPCSTLGHGSNLYYRGGQSAALIGSPPFLTWFGGDTVLYYVTRSRIALHTLT